ncbi:MAG: hypothetical protein PUH29_08505 [Lachnospiraceae bacterium]|nr:hypothetical protein [Lachnospiraceae bacterium]
MDITIIEKATAHYSISFLQYKLKACIKCSRVKLENKAGIKKKISIYSWEFECGNKEKILTYSWEFYLVNREKGYPTYSWELDCGNEEKRYSHIAGNLIAEIKKKDTHI